MTTDQARPGSDAPGSRRARRDFARSFDSLDEIFAFVKPALDQAGAGDADAYAIFMAIEELFTNMVKYNPTGGGRIGLELEFGVASATCLLIDPDSDRFDMTQAPEVDIHRPVEQRRPGGLGIHLVRRLVDSLRYEHAGKCSRITFRRAFSGSVAGGSGAPGLISRNQATTGDGPMFDIAKGDDGVIVLTGRLDAAQCDRAESFLEAAGAPAVFDFRGLEYISSAGLGVLLKAHKRLLAAGGRLRLVNVSKHIHDIFRFSGFDNVFDVERADG
jgi:anti-anti-sigma factor